ncbi:MAG: CHASE2 domain-containing protein, partial [Coleofasciculus sp. C2-GNP5-27]
YKDVHESLLDACQFLKQQEKYLNYPSAHLIPSLFRHPKSEVFRIEPFGFWHRLKRWQPTKREGVWLLGFALISLLPPVQDFLLEPRVFLQAVYRQVTWQIPRADDPAVVLVHIDAKSLRAETEFFREGSKRWNPINYAYLAKLVDQVANLKTKVIGIDYILDDYKQPENSQILGQSIRQAVDQGNWLVFAQIKHDNPLLGGVKKDIANLNWSMEGNISFFQWYVELLPAVQDCSESCPFAYLLALSYSLLNQESPPGDLPYPNLESQQPFRNQIIKTKKQLDQRSAFLQELRLSPLTDFSENFLQLWWQPIIDFSIPPNQAYQSISACELLASCPVQSYIPANLQDKVVLIAPGGYQEAGVKEEGEDNFSMPWAMYFWRKEAGKFFTGGEVHAYMIHQLLTQRLVAPIPDLWMILVAAILGKGIRLILLYNPSQRQKLLKGLGGATAVYGLIGLQVYISAAILIPFVLPSAVFWNYVRLALARES